MILALSLVLFFRLYNKIKSADKNSINLIQFPKETNDKLDSFVNELKQNHYQLVENFNKIQKYTGNIIKDIDDKIAPFEKVAREKNDELKIYKEGYEYTKHKSIINGIIDTIEFIENAEKKIDNTNEIFNSYFTTTKEKLLITLNNSGIETFEPKLGTSAIEDHSCEIDPSTEKTHEELKNDMIYSVLKKGYKLSLGNGVDKIIKKSTVRVFEFEKLIKND